MSGRDWRMELARAQANGEFPEIAAALASMLGVGPGPQRGARVWGDMRIGMGDPGRPAGPVSWSQDVVYVPQPVGTAPRPLMTFNSPDGAPHWWAVMIARDSVGEEPGMDDVNTFVRLTQNAGRFGRTVDMDSVRGGAAVRIYADKIDLAFANNVVGGGNVRVFAAIAPAESATAANEARRTLTAEAAAGATASFTIPVGAVQVTPYLTSNVTASVSFADGKAVLTGLYNTQQSVLVTPAPLDIPNGARTFSIVNTDGNPQVVTAVFRLAL